MEYRSPRFNENGNIDVEINHPEFGWINYTASALDPEPHGREIFNDLKEEAAPYNG